MKPQISVKVSVPARAIACQLVGYGLLLCLIVGDELLDIPHNVFGVPATPVNWTEALIEGLYIVILAGVTTYFSWRFLSRIRILEGFLPICAHCKKIRKDDTWTTLETYMSEHSEARFSHGICPECTERHYGDLLRRMKAPSKEDGEDRARPAL